MVGVGQRLTRSPGQLDQEQVELLWVANAAYAERLSPRQFSCRGAPAAPYDLIRAGKVIDLDVPIKSMPVNADVFLISLSIFSSASRTSAFTVL